MATPLEALMTQKKDLEQKLGSSATAYARNTTPTSSDLSLDTRLASINKQIEDLKSKNLRTTWYGPSEPVVDEGGESTGLIMRGLNALQKPLNAIAGTVQYALGKGTKPSLVSNINEATKTGLVFGDILKQSGASRGVQVPLGFALDVMLDPVNWLTAGTAAIIPRVGTGLVKGTIRGGIKEGLEAAGTGLVSNLERKAATAMNFVPFSRKIANMAPKVDEALTFGDKYRNTMIKGATKYTNLANKLGEKAIEGSTRYDELVGKNIYDKLGKGIYGQKTGIISETLQNVVEKIPSTTILGKATPSGEKLVEFFKYSPKQAADVADLKDKVQKLAKNKGVILTRSAEGADFQSIDEFLSPGATIGVKDKVGDVMNVAIKEADGTLKNNFAGKIKVTDNIDNAKALLEAAREDYNLKNLAEAYKVVQPGQTGVAWYDNAISRLKSTTVDDILHARLGAGETIEGLVEKQADELVQNWNNATKVRNIKPFEKILNAYPTYLSLFKLAKVPMNLASHVVANIGNFFMGAMMGLPVYKFEYYNSVRKANALMRGKLGAKGLQEMFFNDVNSLADMMENNPNRFRQLTGIDPSEILNKLNVEERVLGVKGKFQDDLLKFMREAAARVEEGDIMAARLSELEKTATKAEKEALKQKYNTATETMRNLAEEAPLRSSEIPSSWSAGELTPNTKIDKIKDWIANEAQKPNRKYNPIVQVADLLANSMPRWYEQIDQSWKMGTTDFLTHIGLTEPELLTVSRTVPMTADDILEPMIKNGEKFYRLKPLKASEVAMEAYMNYAAMPDFVKVIRAAPIVGSPFYSFPYAMAVKTAKTAVHNPAVFNKIGAMIDEMNAGRSPQEKQAMEEKYNEYLKSPTVVKMFGMWNTNVKNFIPYYTMNMFNPSERTYGDSFQGQMLKLSDKFPFLQDPIGAVIKDYFIQPWILSGSGELPQGQFGQPLYPTYDEKGNKIEPGLGTKAFYAGRTLGESLIPGTLSYAGLLNAPLGLSPEAINLIPSYGIRNIANATQGRSSVGALTKEDATRKTLRAVLGRTGIPAYTLDVTKTSNK